jgi:hypothetical protein
MLVLIVREFKMLRIQKGGQMRSVENDSKTNKKRRDSI